MRRAVSGVAAGGWRKSRQAGRGRPCFILKREVNPTAQLAMTLAKDRDLASANQRFIDFCEIEDLGDRHQATAPELIRAVV